MINKKEDAFSVAYIEGREDILLEVLADIEEHKFDSVSQVKGLIHIMLDAIKKAKKDYV